MRVLWKVPGGQWQESTIPNALEALQEAVGGYIETLTLTSDKVIICNEEGRLKGMPHCCSILGIDFVGPVLIAGVKSDKFTNCPVSLQEWEKFWAR